MICAAAALHHALLPLAVCMFYHQGDYISIISIYLYLYYIYKGVLPLDHPLRQSQTYFHVYGHQ